MTTERKTFVDLCLTGEVDEEYWDDVCDHHVKEWHRSPGEPSLARYLGMTAEEYHRWLADPDTVWDIIRERRLTVRPGVE